MNWYGRGAFNAMMDANENAPCASIGGLDKRHEPEVVFDWVPEEKKPEFLRGYEDKCREMYGEDWRNVEFSWQPVMRIVDDKVTVLVLEPGE